MSVYRTVSSEVACIILGMPPVDLRVSEHVGKGNGVSKEDVQDKLILRWHKKWEGTTSERWTFCILPNIRSWVYWEHREINFWLIQLLTGHVFSSYLF